MVPLATTDKICLNANAYLALKEWSVIWVSRHVLVLHSSQVDLSCAQSPANRNESLVPFNIQSLEDLRDRLIYHLSWVLKPRCHPPG